MPIGVVFLIVLAGIGVYFLLNAVLGAAIRYAVASGKVRAE